MHAKSASVSSVSSLCSYGFELHEVSAILIDEVAIQGTHSLGK